MFVFYTRLKSVYIFKNNNEQLITRYLLYALLNRINFK